MKLEKDLWLENGYYIDFDEKGQFRIIGPNNHLYCGLIDIPRHKIKIKEIKSLDDSEVKVTGYFLDNRLNLYYPAMDDIRTARVLAGKLSFLEARKQYYDRLVPQQIHRYKKNGNTVIRFSRHYQTNLFYQSTFIFPLDIKVTKINRPFAGFRLMAKKKSIPFTILAKTNDLKLRVACKADKIFIDSKIEINSKIFGKNTQKIKHFWNRTGAEIKHLISWCKTSGDRFGTIFPRDWMESADIGIHDLSNEARCHMYQASLKNVNSHGQGWHEDVVGEFKYEYEISGRDIFDRHMIDIEPHYIIGLEKLPDDFWLDKEVRQKLQLAARHIINKERKNDFITFKKLPPEDRRENNQYYVNGNWRDSEWAFKKISPIIAPFDVNAVFYPKALEVLKKFKKKLAITDLDLDKLIHKWQEKKQHYLFRNKDGLQAYALAICDIKKNSKKISYKKITVNHLDESYLYTYSTADQKEIISFCKRLLDPNYFNTPYGPLLIANNNGLGYTNQEYHGLVVWIKQVAFVILGLSKHLKLAISENWPRETQILIKETMIQICQDIISACIKLNAVPELFFINNGKPQFFPISSSKVQLWSAIGIRRIIRKYIELKTDIRYKKI